MNAFIETRSDMNETVEKLRLFIEYEARSCSIDFGCVTPIYVYRMWGGTVSLSDIETGLREVQNGCR